MLSAIIQSRAEMPKQKKEVQIQERPQRNMHTREAPEGSDGAGEATQRSMAAVADALEAEAIITANEEATTRATALEAEEIVKANEALKATSAATETEFEDATEEATCDYDACI